MYKARKGNYETKQHKARRHKLSQRLNKLASAIKKIGHHIKAL